MLSNAMHLRPSLTLGALPPVGSVGARLSLAATAGFEGVEAPAPETDTEADDLAGAAIDAGLTWHLVEARGLHSHPLASRTAADVSVSVAATLRAIAVAQRAGAAVQVVLGRVPADMRLQEQYSRAQHVLTREILPAAVEAGVPVVVENVWRDCLTTPERFVDFVDGLDCPLVGCLFDTGNVFDGHPEDWLPILGHRVVRLHTKDFRLDMAARRFAWPPIGDGEVQWDRVRSALETLTYTGWATCADNTRGSAAAVLAGAAARTGMRSGTLARMAKAVLHANRRRTALATLTDVRRRFAQHLQGEKGFG